MSSEHHALRFDLGATVAPGDRLVAARGWTPGPGTYLRQGYVYAATAGTLEESSSQQPKVLTVNPNKLASLQVIRVGQVVLCRVVRLLLQQASVDIVAVEGLGELGYAYEAVIRREDVRKTTTTTDIIHMTQAFRPGDLVVARVLSLGDTRRYFLSTAEPQLGVIHAVSARSGQVMMPISWKEMECPETGEKEARKCARPQNVA